MKEFRNELAYLFALLAGSMKSYGPERKRLLIMSVFMMIQNSMFFALWIILFGTVRDMNGWQLQEVARMFGITASAVGMSLFFFNGARTIAYRILDGTLDSYLTKPRHPLPALLFSSSYPASLGDIFYGPLIWYFLGNLEGYQQWGIIILVTLLAAVVFISTSLIFYCIPFWLKGNTRFPEQLFEMFIIATTNILHGQPLGVKIVVFTLIPAAYVAYVPVLLANHFSWGPLLILISAACFYAWAAIKVFNAGVRKYVQS